MRGRVKLGNNVNVYVALDVGDGVCRATCEWESPPLGADDERQYLAMVPRALP